MSKRTLHTLALFFLGAAIGSGLYGVTSDSNSETLTLILTSVGFLCVVLAMQKSKSA